MLFRSFFMPLTAGPTTRPPRAISAACLMVAWRTPPLVLGCLLAMKVSIMAAASPVETTLAPLSSIDPLVWLTLMAAMVPALIAALAACSHGILAAGPGSTFLLREAEGG